MGTSSDAVKDDCVYLKKYDRCQVFGNSGKLSTKDYKTGPGQPNSGMGVTMSVLTCE